MNETCCIYTAITKKEGEYNFFKIGITRNIVTRIPSIQTGCPLKIAKILVIPLPEGMRMAQILEAKIHIQLKPFHTHGEWFRFNTDDPAHKAAFNEGCRTVFMPFIGTGWKWLDYTARGLAVFREIPELLQAEK